MKPGDLVTASSTFASMVTPSGKMLASRIYDGEVALVTRFHNGYVCILFNGMEWELAEENLRVISETR